MILHVARAAAWAEAQRSGTYAPPELARDGFLHCCTAEQLAFVLDRHFAGVAGLVVLAVDPALIEGRVEWVRSEEGMAAFPHVHGAVPAAALGPADDAAQARVAPRGARDYDAPS